MTRDREPAPSQDGQDAADPQPLSLTRLALKHSHLSRLADRPDAIADGTRPQAAGLAHPGHLRSHLGKCDIGEPKLRLKDPRFVSRGSGIPTTDRHVAHSPGILLFFH